MEGRREGKNEVCEGGTESKPGGKRDLRKEQERKGWGEKTEERKGKRRMEGGGEGEGTRRRKEERKRGRGKDGEERKEGWMDGRRQGKAGG